MIVDYILTTMGIAYSKPKRVPKDKQYLALHRAVESELVEVIEVLMNEGELRQVPDQDGDTPLHIAVKKNNRQIVEILCNEL